VSDTQVVSRCDGSEQPIDERASVNDGPHVHGPSGDAAGDRETTRITNTHTHTHM